MATTQREINGSKKHDMVCYHSERKPKHRVTGVLVTDMKNRTRNNRNQENIQSYTWAVGGGRVDRREHAGLVDVDEIEVGVDLGHKTESR